MTAKIFGSCAVAALVLAVSAPAQAALTLTQAGTDAGFTLSTFVSGYSFGGSPNYGPIAQGIDSAGHVITGSFGTDRVYVFNDVDNQQLGDAISATPYTLQTSNPNIAMTTLDGHVYGAQLFGGTYKEFFDDGSSVDLTGAVSGLRNNLGVWGDPASGLLYAASTSGIAKIDPTTGTFTILNGIGPDGITVSTDGSILYAENGGVIQSYSTATGLLLHSFGSTGGRGPDGTGVITGGKFGGDVIVNNNDGTVGLLDPTKADGELGQYVIIASGGTRGDFVSPDRSNGTLFMSELDAVYRLSCGTGCAIGSTNGVPEPQSWALMLLGFISLGAAARRRRALARA